MVTDECFMTLQILAHDLDTLMGPPYSSKTGFKQTDIVIVADKGSVMQRTVVQLSSCGLFKSLEVCGNVPVRKSSVQ